MRACVSGLIIDWLSWLSELWQWSLVCAGLRALPRTAVSTKLLTSFSDSDPSPSKLTADGCSADELAVVIDLLAAFSVVDVDIQNTACLATPGRLAALLGACQSVTNLR